MSAHVYHLPGPDGARMDCAFLMDQPAPIYWGPCGQPAHRLVTGLRPDGTAMLLCQHHLMLVCENLSFPATPALPFSQYLDSIGMAPRT